MTLVNVPKTIAFFETTLAASLNDTATAFTLTAATDKDGTVLADDTYSFVIDEGSSNEEIVICRCIGTTVTEALRGVSVATGNTEVTALKKTHRRGASVKMTTAPIVPIIANIMRGEDELDFTPTLGGSIVTKDYADGIAAAGAPDAGTGTKGIAKLSVAAASPTNPIVVGDNDPRVPTTDEKAGMAGGGVFGTPSTSNKFITEDKFATTPKVDVYTAGATWTKPTGAKSVEVVVIGGGGGGAVGTINSTAGAAGGGGGGMSHCVLNAAALASTETVTVGDGGASATNGNPSSFGDHLLANGGQKGVTTTPGAGGQGTFATGGAGGAAGTDSGNGGTAPTIFGLAPTGGGGGGGNGGNGGNGGSQTAGSIAGGTGSSGAGAVGGAGVSVTANLNKGGTGGGGGGSTSTASTQGGDGGAGGIYGAGGGAGGGSGSGATATGGGAGADGLVLVISHF